MRNLDKLPSDLRREYDLWYQAKCKNGFTIRKSFKFPGFKNAHILPDGNIRRMQPNNGPWFM